MINTTMQYIASSMKEIYTQIEENFTVFERDFGELICGEIPNEFAYDEIHGLNLPHGVEETIELLHW